MTLPDTSDLLTKSTMTMVNNGTDTAQVELTLLLDGNPHIDNAHVFTEDVAPGYTVTLSTAIGCKMIRSGTHTDLADPSRRRRAHRPAARVRRHAYPQP